MYCNGRMHTCMDACMFVRMYVWMHVYVCLFVSNSLIVCLLDCLFVCLIVFLFSKYVYTCISLFVIPHSTWSSDFIVVDYPAKGNLLGEHAYRSDPTLIVDADKAWAMSQMLGWRYTQGHCFVLGWYLMIFVDMACDHLESTNFPLTAVTVRPVCESALLAKARIPKVKFVVMLRDPVDWLASRICRIECSAEHKFLDLCDAQGNAQSPLLHWLVYCTQGALCGWNMSHKTARLDHFYSRSRSKITTLPQRRAVLWFFLATGSWREITVLTRTYPPKIISQDACSMSCRDHVVDRCHFLDRISMDQQRSHILMKLNCFSCFRLDLRCKWAWLERGIMVALHKTSTTVAFHVRSRRNVAQDHPEEIASRFLVVMIPCHCWSFGLSLLILVPYHCWSFWPIIVGHFPLIIVGLYGLSWPIIVGHVLLIIGHHQPLLTVSKHLPPDPDSPPEDRLAAFSLEAMQEDPQGGERLVENLGRVSDSVF